ncbi:hypothetical protein A2U01_0105782, partial [Trifolium medium]|nr:hypothetical protein [Trifolium medium]
NGSLCRAGASARYSERRGFGPDLGPVQNRIRARPLARYSEQERIWANSWPSLEQDP